MQTSEEAKAEYVFFYFMRSIVRVIHLSLQLKGNNKGNSAGIILTQHQTLNYVLTQFEKNKIFEKYRDQGIGL